MNGRVNYMFNLIFTNDFSIDTIGNKEKYILKLENLLIDYNNKLLLGITEVDDNTYTNCIELLEMLNPNSPLLENYREVKFIKSLDEKSLAFLEKEVKDLDVLKFYLNPEGFNVRLVYEYGELVEANTFGRSFKKQDVLDLMYLVLTDRNENLSELGRVEIEGTLVVPFDNMDMVRFHCTAKNPYQAVFSILSYFSNNEEDIEEDDNLENYVHFIATDVKTEGLPFNSINDKYSFLENSEFLIPDFFEIEKTGNLSYDIDTAFYYARREKMNYEYLTDGVRLLVMDDEIIIFKMSSWDITSFEGIVEKIEWVDDKCKKLPVLKLKEPIKVTEELIVTDIVLNSINLLLILDIEINSSIRFAYFGGMGILPITKNGEIILN